MYLSQFMQMQLEKIVQVKHMEWNLIFYLLLEVLEQKELQH